MLQFGYTVLQGVQLLPQPPAAAAVAVTACWATRSFLQRQHLGQQLPLQLVHLGVQGSGHHRRRGWGGAEKFTRAGSSCCSQTEKGTFKSVKREDGKRQSPRDVH